MSQTTMIAMLEEAEDVLRRAGCDMTANKVRSVLQAQQTEPVNQQLLDALKQLVRVVKLQHPWGASISKAEKAIAAAEQAQQTEPVARDDEWRMLAMQFDGHRMQALAHLRCLLENPESHSEAARSFLAAPPLSGDQVLEYRISAMSQRSNDWEPSGIDYDRSMHGNPDAAAWAKFFVETFPGLKGKEGLMLGWFANAMMAMHDHLKAQPPAVADRDAIRRVFMAHGFTIKEGQTDLKPYVYEAAEALLRELSPPVAVPDATVGKLRLLVAACNRIEEEAEELEGPDGLGMGIAMDYWHEFAEALTAARKALAAAPQATAEECSVVQAVVALPKAPTWYKRSDIVKALERMNYHTAIADELADWFLRHMQLAFNRGFYQAHGPAAATQLEELELWHLLERATGELTRRAAPHAWEQIAWRAGTEFIEQRRARLAAAQKGGAA